MRPLFLLLALTGVPACSSGTTPADAGTHESPHDAATHDASSADARIVDARIVDASAPCPLIEAATCGIGLPACTGCCVDFDCLPEGASCGKELGTCHTGSCSDHGALGQLCASGKAADSLEYRTDGSIACGYSPWTGCTDTRSVCEDGGCVACGQAGELCCDLGCGPDTYCDPTNHCNAACGALGQTCCGREDLPYTCKGSGACLYSGAGLPTCVDGTACQADAGNCTTCGNQDQPCCQDSSCNANGRDTCMPNGKCMFATMK